MEIYGMTNHQSNKNMKKGFQFVKVLKSSKKREIDRKIRTRVKFKNLEIKSLLLVDIFSPKAFHICILLLSLLDRDLLCLNRIVLETS